VTDFFDGFVLRGAKTSQTNATTSAPADSGVARDVISLVDWALYPAGGPDLAEVRADQYRTAVLDSPLGSEQEFLVWAANTGSLTTLEGPEWATTDGTGKIPKGSIPVLDPASPTGESTDGSARLVLTDDGGRDIAGVVSISLQRGGTTFVLTLADGDFSFVAGSSAITLLPTVATLTATAPADPDAPALSLARGDSIVAVSYWISAIRFWWTRNDSYARRFGWNGATSKWEPYRGGAPLNLSPLSSDGRSYVLSPRPTTPVGSSLPGSIGDSYAMIRLGTFPDSTSYPVVDRTTGDYSGVRVVPDDLANADYDFASVTPPLAGVVGAGAGRLVWNPAFIQAYEGQTVWYVPRTFSEKSNGVIGLLRDAISDPLFLAPVPGPGERPIVRIGNRAPLVARAFDTEAALLAATIAEGEAGFATSTGLLILSPDDVAKAEPGTRISPEPFFDKLFLGAVVRYDGITLNFYPQPVKAPVLLVDSSGTPVTSYDPAVSVFIPDATTLPGLGASGILRAPDRLGNPPSIGAVTPRPGDTGLVRTLSSGIGDVILFSPGRSVTRTIPVGFEDELPTDPYRVSGDLAYVSLEERVGAGSLVFFGSVPRKDLTGKPIYFRTGEFVPATYATEARLFSRIRDSFVLDGTETLNFLLGPISVLWSASLLGAGTFSAATIANDIYARIILMAAPGISYALNGRIAISHLDLEDGSVSIGFGTGGVLDLSGATALGFLPGWRTAPTGADQSATDPNWLSDFGGEFGFYRSPRDLDGSQGISDYVDKYRLEERTLTESVSPTTFHFLDYAPREDIAGYDEGVFFTLSAAGAPGVAPVVESPLLPWEDVKYLFEEQKFAWLTEGGGTAQVQGPIASINLGAPGVVPETFIAQLGGFLRLAEGGPFQYLEPDLEFLLPKNGGPGEAVLLTKVGDLRESGARGRFSAGADLLTDLSANFTSTASVGDRLKLTSGDDQGSYLVEERVSATVLRVSPEFLSGDSGLNVSYQIFRGVAPGAVDPTVVADVVYETFNHLAEEPFSIRVLTQLGVAEGALSNADCAKDITRGRPIFARISQVGTDYPLSILARSELGVIANGVLFVPTTGVRFTSGAFDLRVGTTDFVQGASLVPVASFSPDPGSQIEYLTPTGELKFGSVILENYASASVWYVETLLATTDLATGEAEVNPDSGEVQLSAVDLASGAGEPVYFVEELSVEGTTDATVNPILGAFTFLANPIRAYQLVEVTYYRAVPNTGELFLDEAGNPVQIKQFLPLFLRAEIATRISSQLYSFNPTGRTVDTSISPIVYAGSKQLTYGVPLGCTVDFATNKISLNEEVPVGTKVTISYGVYEAFGGETSYTVSNAPVWRPPFNLSKGASLFLLDSDRRADVVVGKVLRVGAFSTYIASVAYDSASDTTTVGISPAPTNGAGSLNPGANALSLLSDRPVKTNSGFLPTAADAFDLSETPRFEPVTAGQVEIKFEGDLTRYAVAGHLLEIDGKPFGIVKGELAADGRFTTVTVASPFPSGFSWSSGMVNSLVKISVRPIYPEGSTQFLGKSPFLPTESYEVVLFGETNEDGETLPGRTLALGADYVISETNGNLSFTTPRQSGLVASQILYFARTDSRSIGPFLYKGAVQYPRVSTNFRFTDPPSVRNGRVGGVLQATYTFEAPDAFYVRALPFETLVGEVALDLKKQATAAEPSNGPTISTGVSKSNADYGRAGLVTERQNLTDRDRVARAFLGFYNAVVSSFEQIEETLNGSLVGERDGKLRLYVGKNDPWVPPGYEDDISGTLNPRNLWFDVWMSARRGLPTIRLIAADPILEPLSATADSNGRPSGTYQEPSSFSALSNFQEVLVKNDVDDVALVARNRTERKLAGFVYFRVTAFGSFAGQSEASPFSRLFPERTTGFTTLGPGLDGNEETGNPGVYSAGKFGFDPLGFLFGSPFSCRSTTGSVIGQLENPVLGPIQNVLGLKARDRLARARIWSYSPTGFPEIDVLSTGRPALIATPLPIADFPILSDTGLPDTTRLASQSGGSLPTGLYDLLTGDPDLHTPPFAVGAQLAIGYPAGNATELGYAGSMLPVGAEFRYAGVFVEEILQGCVVLLKSKDPLGADVSITDPSLLLTLTGPAAGDVLDPARGDTLFAVPGTGSVLVVPTDPVLLALYRSFLFTPTAIELGAYVSTIPEYRIGTDLNFNARTGELLDATLPSFSDPTVFGLKEITGQNPPDPLSTLEAKISFQNGSRLPTRIPALDGLKTLDSGDYSLPYYGSPVNELELLGAAAALVTDLIRLDSPDPPAAPPSPFVAPYVTEAVYPDETLDSEGVVAVSANQLATLATFEDLARGTTSGDYPPPSGHAGVGDVKPYDLVLVQAPTGVPGLAGFPLGATGIHSIADITSGSPNQIDLPRFVTAVNAPSSFDYIAEHAIAWVGYPAYAEGIVVRQDTTLVPTNTSFDVSTISPGSVVFDDGLGGGLLPVPVGGLNDIFALNGKGSRLTIRLIDKTTGEFVSGSTVIVEKFSGGADILACAFEVSGDDGVTFVSVAPGGFYCLPNQIVIRTTAPDVFFNFTPYNPVIAPAGVTTTGGFHDFSISVYSTAGRTASIDQDRLTFREALDFRSALPRGFTHPSFPGGSLMEAQLSTLEFDCEVFDTTLAAGTTRANFCNDIATINAGLPFTFPARTSIAPSVNGVGTFAANVGELRVLGFEGRGNVPIEATDIVFSAIPSSRQDAEGPIFNGILFVGEVLGAGAPYSFLEANVFVPLTVYAGGFDRVQPGDIAVVRGVFDPSMSLPLPVGTGKAGTYLVRAGVERTPVTLPGHRLDLSVAAGSSGSWFDFEFPTVVEFDDIGATLTVSSLLPLPDLQDLDSVAVAVPFAFPASGRVYLIRDTAGVGTATATVSAAYTSLDAFNVQFLGLSDYQDGLGVAITIAEFEAAALAGTRVSGMTVLPVRAASEGLVPENLPGYTFWPTPPVGSEFFFGFRTVTASRVPFGTVVYDAGAATLVGVPPSLLQIAVYAKVKISSTTFVPLDTPVYDNIAGAMDVTNFDWSAIHGSGPTCLFPGDLFDLRYHAKDGLFVEPSFPISGNDLAASSANVVDASHSLSSTDIGTREASSYITGGGPAGGSYLEFAQVEVLRIRRFHPLLEELAASLVRLRFAYEIRRGIVASFTSTNSAGSLVAEPVDTSNPPLPLAGGGATQLGDFTLADIGVRSGDSIRFLDALGAVIAETEILVVETDGKTLTVSKNAVASVVPGTRFEVYLRTAPIPQEQSCAELLELATDEVLLDRRADLVWRTGGKVTYIPDADLQVAYDQSINVLSDTSGTVDFAALGIEAGDILVIDPAGVLRGPTGFPADPERGARPFGDEGVLPRGAPVYTAGSPLRTDDNRGYYKVSTVSATELGVVPLGGNLAGDRLTGDAIFDDQYAVYPTVHGSNLSGTADGLEGQMDLRPTSFANASNSFASDYLSIAPFSYRVIRPTSFLSEATIELLLSTRERMLSWMEELRGLFESEKSGSYFVFQRDEHIADIGDSSDPLVGLGVLFDAYIATLEGRVLVSPFANTSDCLSILDRRFWGLDFRLDYLRPPFHPLDPAYADFAGGVGRPVLPDRIEEALQQRDRLRDSRWAWLTLRTDRVNGTLEAIRRFDRELPRRRAEQERLLAMVKGTENV